MSPSLDAILGSLSESETGGGSALTRTVQNVGASLGVAIMGSVLNNAYQAHLGGSVSGLPASVQAAAQSSVAVAAAGARHLPSPLGSRLLRAAQGAYVAGMSDVLMGTAGELVGGGLLMAALP